MEENLKKVMKTPAVLFLGINGVIGGGIFLLPGQVAKISGVQALWAYLVAGLVCVLIGLSFAESSTLFNRTGGAYVYAEEAMGKAVGFSVGWMAWLTYLLGWSALANGFVDYLVTLFPGVATMRPLVIVVVVGLLCLLNSFGVKNGSSLVNFFSIAKLIPLLLLIAVGLFHTSGGGLQAVPKGHGSFGQAVLMLIFAFGGFEMATVPAGEMVNPKKAIRTAVLGTLAGVTVFYLLIQYASFHLVPGIASSKAPLATAGSVMFAGGLGVMTVGALLSILGTQSGLVLAAPRALYALGANRSLPKWFGNIHPTFKTPLVAIWTTGVLVMILAGTGTFTHLVLLNVAARLYQYLMVCVSTAVLRFTKKEAVRPFKLPFGPLLPLLGVVVSVWLLAQETGQQLLYAFCALLIGLLIYWLSNIRKKSEAFVEAVK